MPLRVIPSFGRDWCVFPQPAFTGAAAGGDGRPESCPSVLFTTNSLSHICLIITTTTVNIIISITLETFCSTFTPASAAKLNKIDEHT